MEGEKNGAAREYDLALHWCVTNTCNFSCTQCAGYAVKMKGKYVPEKINIRQLRKFLDSLDGTAQFTFSGGEPLYVKNIIEAFQEITKKHYLVLVTNMTSDKAKVMAEKINPERINCIKASAHCFELERNNMFDNFFKHYHLLKDKGNTICVADVAYPFMADKVDYYRKLFADNGIDLEFQAFRGTWKGKKYPDEYTKEELQIFNLVDTATTAYRTDIFNHKGSLCNAGYNVAIIDRNCDVYPCYFIHNKMGSIKKGMKFSDQLITCPLEYCDCPVQVLDPYLFDKALKATGHHEHIHDSSVV